MGLEQQEYVLLGVSDWTCWLRDRWQWRWKWPFSVFLMYLHQTWIWHFTFSLLYVFACLVLFWLFYCALGKSKPCYFQHPFQNPAKEKMVLTNTINKPSERVECFKLGCSEDSSGGNQLPKVCTIWFRTYSHLFGQNTKDVSVDPSWPFPTHDAPQVFGKNAVEEKERLKAEMPLSIFCVHRKSLLKTFAQ